MADRLRILITDEDPDSRVETRKAVQRAQLLVVGEVGYGTEAVSLAIEARPDIVLIAMQEPMARPLETAEALANALPDTPIIVYSSTSDPEAVRRTMVFGARDYIMKPVQAARLAEAVNTVLVQEERRQMRRAGQLTASHGRGTVITVTGAKGGIGKTVTSVNLALALRRETGKQVVLLDADTQFGDVTTMLDLTADRSVADVLRLGDRLDRQNIHDFLVPHRSGVEVLAAPADDGVWSGSDDGQVKRVIDLLAQTHDFVVVDTAGSFDTYARACIEAASITLVITTGEVSSVRDTAAALRRVDSWQVDRDRVKILLNRGVRVSGFGLRELQEAIQKEIFWEIPYDRRFPISVQLGQPVMAEPRRSVGARSLIALARLIAGTKKSLVPERKGRSAFKFLFNSKGAESDTAMAAVQDVVDRERRSGLRRFIPILGRRGAAAPETDPRYR